MRGIKVYLIKQMGLYVGKLKYSILLKYMNYGISSIYSLHFHVPNAVCHQNLHFYSNIIQLPALNICGIIDPLRIKFSI